MYDFLIVGSGLYGAVCAQQLIEKGYSVLVIDKRNNLGGNIYTEKMEGINVHVYGAHIFHTSDEAVWKYINRFCEFNNYVNCPVANYKGELYNLPFNMNTFYQLWKVKTPEEAIAKIEEEKAKFPCKTPSNLEEQAISLAGSTIYEKLIKGYTEKQWGKLCNQLPAFIIKRVPLRFVFDNNYFNDRYQGIPIGGYTPVIEKLLKGADIRLNCDFNEHKDELMKMAKRIIFTGPIDEFFSFELGALEYRSLRFETEVVDTNNYQGNAVINYTDKETPFTRLIEHKHFEFDTKSPKSVITREYSKTWKQGDEPYYPVNDERNAALYAKYLEKAKELDNVYFGGRLGLYQYLNMDQIIAKAIDFCKSF